MEEYQVYKDIKSRTDGEIYIGVVGPVRTGKSTFVKRFMEQMVIPNIEEGHGKQLAIDELPQSAAGRTIMTTEPKFIPKEAITVNISDSIDMRVKMIDCVGYVTEGAEGQLEEGKERMVRTPWLDYDIPFSRAAEIGTNKVINNHSTVGIVVTTDGSIGEIPRESYIPAEEKTIAELRSIGKPFVVLLNTDKPMGSRATKLAQELSEVYNASVIPINIEQMRQVDIEYIFSELLLSFPVTSICFDIPKWLEVAPEGNSVKNSIVNDAGLVMQAVECLRDVDDFNFPENEYVKKYRCSNIDMAEGKINIQVDVHSELYYQMLTEMMGMEIRNEYDFITELKNMSKQKSYFDNVSGALAQVDSTGYGLVMPERQNISLEKPEVIKNGGKYGVRISAKAPSLHMIKADVTTEIMPLVGNKQQADDLMSYIEEHSSEGDMWGVNIFGKTIQQLVEDGLSEKVRKINTDSQQKLQNTMEKIVNDGNGGMVCIII
jgi:stage IV sporulation protein A